MTYTGAYLIGSQTLRLYHLETSKPSSQWLDNEPHQPTTWTPETLKERLVKVFNIIKGELKCLILVNSTQLSIELLKLAHETGLKYAKEVKIISATVARLQWATAETKLSYLNPGDKALIAFFINDICEFDELEVSSPSTFILNSVRKCSPPQAQKILVERTRSIRPKAVVFVCTHEKRTLKEWFESRYRGRMHYILERPDYILMNGGLAKAATIYPGTRSPPFDIEDFASGYKIEYINMHDEKCCDALIPFNEKLPAKNVVELVKMKTFCIKYNEEITVAPIVPPQIAYGRLLSTILHENTRAISVRVTANINKSGVPYIKVDAQKMIDIPTTSTAASSSYAAAATTSALSNLTLSSNSTKRNTFDVNKVQFIVKLKANMGSIWSKTDRKEYALLNVNQNEWTPFFVSFHRADVKIGEKAVNDSKKYPTSVVKDIHKIIGVPMKKIETDARWKFEIVPTPNDPKNTGMFQVETFDGIRQFCPAAIMSMFIMALKKLAERQFDTVIKKIAIQVASEDYKPEQLGVVKKAAESAGIEVENIEYMNF